MPALHQSTPAAGDANAPVDLRQSVYQSLLGKGLTSQQALGVLYSMMGESGGGFNTNAIGDNQRSIGFGQWNGSRRAALEATAAKMGTTWQDPSAQLAHFNNEISGPYAAEIERVKQANSTADATRIWTGSVGEGSGYERPQVNNWQARFAEGSRNASLDSSGNLTFKSAPAATTAASGAAAPGAATPGAAPATSGAQDFSAAANKGDVGGMIASLAKGQGQDGQGASPLSKLSESLGGQQKAAAPQTSQQLLGQAPRSPDLAGPAQQLYGQVLAQSARPLSWSTRPFGSGMAGPQIPGVTLNSANPYG